MTTRRIAPTGLLLAAALLLGACGVTARSDGGAAAPARPTGPTTTTSGPARPTTTTTTDGSPQESSTTVPRGLSPQQRTAVSQMVSAYEDLGLAPDDAQCLAEGIAKGYGSIDQAKLLDLIGSCGISYRDLAKVAGSLGATTPSDGISKGMEAALERQGLTKAQAACVGEAFVKEYGTDLAAMQDASKLLPIFDDCDVSPSDLRPGG